MIVELLDRRVLGAIAFVDGVTRQRVSTGLRVESDALTLRPQASGLYVIHGADGFEKTIESFDEPAAPPPGAPIHFAARVFDPERRYLARAFDVTLPRPSTPVTDPTSVLVPLEVDLLPASAMPVPARWATWRVRVQIAGSVLKTGLANVLVRVTPQLAGFTTQLALTDAHGEALVVIPNAPSVMPSAGNGGGGGGTPVLVKQFEATVSLIVDASVARAEGASVPPLADPQRIVARSAPPQAGVRVLTKPNVTLAAGRSVRSVIEVSFP
ncbi:MAG TPA: hypothetical protein VFS42_00765 [Burkholderiaceae bacterium]|nr:hypothetical protein [Burkholderiaceae bacterium]